MASLADADSRIQSVVSLIRENRQTEAEEALAPLAADHRSEASLLRGVMALHRGAADAALALIGRAVQLDIDHPDALAGLAAVQLALGRPGFACVPAERAARIAPGMAAPVVALAAAYGRLGRTREAIALLRQAALSAALIAGLSCTTPGLRRATAPRAV